MKLEDLQQSRRKAAGAAAVKALHAVKAESGSLAKAVRAWSKSTKAINAALKRYELATADVENLRPPSPIDAKEFARCLRDCTGEQQRGVLTDLLNELALQRVYIERAGKKAARRKVKRQKRRAKRSAQARELALRRQVIVVR